MREVLDTSVHVAAIRSLTGASGLRVEAVVAGDLNPLVSVPLVLEYESVLTRPEHLAGSASAQTNVDIVKAFCLMGEAVHISHRLRPQLVDADDEFVLEAAYHGRADTIVTINTRDFLKAAKRFCIAVLKPGGALERIRQQ